MYAYDALTQPVENVPILSVATAYNDPISGDTYILVFHETLSYGTKLDHSLINPNQVRAYGIPFWDNPYDPDRGLSIDVNDSLHIPLQPVGTKLQFCTRVPVTQELQDCEHISMTSPCLCLEPNQNCHGATNESRRKDITDLSNHIKVTSTWMQSPTKHS